MILSTITSRLSDQSWNKLRRAGAAVDDLIYYYKSAIRSVLECAYPVRHSRLSKRQSREVESQQGRATRTIFLVIFYTWILYC